MTIVTTNQTNSLLKELPVKYDVFRNRAQKVISSPGTFGKGKLIAAGIGLATTLVGNLIANYLEEDEGMTGNGLPTPISQTKTRTFHKARRGQTERNCRRRRGESISSYRLRCSRFGKYRRGRNR